MIHMKKTLIIAIAVAVFLVYVCWYFFPDSNSGVVITESSFTLDIIGQEEQDWIPEGYPTNWECVSDPSDETYVSNVGSAHVDRYTLSSVPQGYRDYNVVQVSVKARLCGNIGSNSASFGLVKPGFDTNTRQIYISTEFPTFMDYEYTLTECPWPGRPWNWDDIDELRIILRGDNTAYCSNLYLEVETDFVGE